MKEINSNILSDITVHMKYAKYIPELKRRETWNELVDRNMAMHIKKYPKLEVEIRKAYSYVFTKQILPSMRSLQFAGKPIESSFFDCTYQPLNSGLQPSLAQNDSTTLEALFDIADEPLRSRHPIDTKWVMSAKLLPER